MGSPALTTDIGEYHSSSFACTGSQRMAYHNYRKQFGNSIRNLIGLKPSDHSKTHPIKSGEHELDRIRREEFSRLDDSNTVYLDYAGAALYPKSLLSLHYTFLEQHVLGNPHSGSPASMMSSQIELQTRSTILAYFDADPEQYMVVFTSNASGALKLVAEAYPFGPSNRLILGEDSHNSLHGMRMFSAKANARTDYFNVLDSGLIDTESFEQVIQPPEKADEDAKGTGGLLVFTAQSNVTGIKQDLGLVRKASQMGLDTIVDVAALASTSRVSLRKIGADAAIVSFYKMFGYPTGVGALIMKQKFSKRLHRPYFGGGTVETVQVPGINVTMVEGPRRFEDGTINFLSLSAIIYGLQFMNGVIDLVQERVRGLLEYTIQSLSTIRYHNGSPLVTVHGAVDSKRRGGSLALTFHKSNGDEVDCEHIEILANKERISLRSGCMCNPAMAAILVKRRRDVGSIGQNLTFSSLLEKTGAKSLGVVRISFGIASNQRDADRFIGFASTLARHLVLD